VYPPDTTRLDDIPSTDIIQVRPFLCETLFIFSVTDRKNKAKKEMKANRVVQLHMHNTGKTAMMTEHYPIPANTLHKATIHNFCMNE